MSGARRRPTVRGPTRPPREAMGTMEKINLFGMAHQELIAFFTQRSHPRYRAGQVYRWMYQKGVDDLEAMTNLPLALRQALESEARVAWPAPTSRVTSADGSIKYLFDLDERHRLETVYLPSDRGATVCVSTQLGCAQGCCFCQTGQLGFVRNLSAAEIVGQVQVVVRDWQLEPPFNIVVMGMGEPLLNLKNLLCALEIFSAPDGFGLSPKHITVSTSGHVPNLLKLCQLEHPPRIAISLNATTDEQRDRIMPINRRWPIASLLEACRGLPLPRRERITFEYVLIREVNDSQADALRLVQLLSGLRCKVNLIPYNASAGLPFLPPTQDAISRFRSHLDRAGLVHTLRKSMGQDIGAACGQLAGTASDPLPRHMDRG